jgi:predicted nucleic acid-binding protein
MSSNLHSQLTKFVSRHRDDGIFLDTNVLLLLLFGKIQPSMIGTKRLAKYTLQDAQLLVGYVSQFKRILTTSHVLAETSNLAAQMLKYRLKDEFFTQIFQSFCGNDVDVFHQCETRNLSINEAIFVQLGLTDATVVSAMSDKRLLLTDDLDLYLKALSNGAPSINFTHMREVAETV